MKGLKMVMSVRLCEGSMGTLTSETVETKMGYRILKALMGPHII